MGRLFVLIAACALLGGCGYRMGFAPREGVRRVSVPVFKNLSFRRELELALTRATIREIQSRTPVRVVERGDADAVLEGVIRNAGEQVLVEGLRDEVIASNVQVEVACRLVRKDGRVLAEQTFTEPAEVVESRGETRDQAFLEAMDDLAERIVGMLEEW